MIKKIIFVFLILISVSNFAQENKFGIGILVGVPTGFSGKLILSEMNSLDVGVGYSFSGENEKIHLYVDYIWNDAHFFKSSSSFKAFYGIGGRVKTFDFGDNSMAVRIIGGVNYNPTDTKIELFFETAPTINVVPNSNFSLEGAIGLRYFF